MGMTAGGAGQAAEFDAVVVGSGVTGGMAAYNLTRLGLKTLVLEAGGTLSEGKKAYGSETTNLMRQLRELWVHGHQNVQRWHGGFWESNPALYIKDKDYPYTTPEGKPYYWIRGRQVGGRSHTWGGVCLRFSEYDFQANARDKKGTAWPLEYSELAPYYEYIEHLLRVHGAKDGVATLPDGNFLEPSRFSPGEVHMQERLAKEFDRRVVISRGIKAARRAEGKEPYTRLSSPQTTLKAAMETGNLTVRSHAQACRVVHDSKTRKATAVEYINTLTGKTESVSGKLIVLCASTIESIRLLLLSELGNTSGKLGRGIMDHLVRNVYFLMPEHREQKGYELLGSDGVIIPRYINLWDNPGSQASDFTRGYGYWGGVSRLKFPEFLRKTPEQALGFLCSMAETLPDDSNRVTLSDTKKDKWGVPVPHIDCKWTAEDLKLADRMYKDAAEMVQAVGGKLVNISDLVRTPFVGKFMGELNELWRLTQPGLFVHEVGGAVMGTRAEDSVTNPWGQLWDAPNVVLGDGAVFPSSAWQNPSLTEMALCLRATENAGQKLKAGEL